MMRIWIRSQNIDSLINADEVFYSSTYLLKRGNFILGRSHGSARLLGEYSTKAKAISVLDSIHKSIEAINKDVHMAAQTCPFGRFLIQDYKVFQMPQNYEV